MEVYIIGVFKKAKNITGFRLLNCANNNIETKDVSYDALYNVLAQNRLTVKNAKLEANAIKAVNGSFDRYAEPGKGQSATILREVHNNNQFYGYLCSDTNGNVRIFSQADLIKHCNNLNMQISNGKIVNNSDGTSNISAIEGSYEVWNRQQTQQAKPQEPVKREPEDKKAEQQQPAKTGNPNYDKAAEINEELKKYPEYPKTFAKKVFDTIDKEHKCSDKQLAVFEKTLKEFQDRANGVRTIYDDAVDTINELKTYPKFKGSFASKVADTILRDHRCSEKQLGILTKELKKYQDEKSKDSNNINDTSKNAIIENNDNAVAENKDAIMENKDDAVEKEEKEQLNNSNDTQDSKTTVDNKDDNASLENKDAIIEKPSVPTEKAKLDKSINIIAPDKHATDIFEFELTQSGKAAVIGFNKKLDNSRIPKNILIPDTIDINGKIMAVEAIRAKSFKGTPIVSVTTGPNITDIGQEAFAECKSLTSVNLSKSRHSHIAMRTFALCEALDSILMGNYVQRVHEDAFMGCRRLVEVTIPNSCDTIARQAFAYCSRLRKVNSNAQTINEKAFFEDFDLEEFDFTPVHTIGSSAFAFADFKELTLGGNLVSIGDKAFANCRKLSKVVLTDGLLEIGSSCFRKSATNIRSAYNNRMQTRYDVNTVEIETIDTVKSIKKIDSNAFEGAKLVKGYVGSIAESHCRGFNIPFLPYDSVSTDNSARGRIKSNMLGTNAVLALYDQLKVDKEGVSNPDFEMRTNKLVDIELSDAHLHNLGVNRTTEVKEPHIKFKALVNYLQDTTDLFTLPFSDKIIKMNDLFFRDSKKVYDDGCNLILKTCFSIRDSLEHGSFYVVIQNNRLRFCADCNYYNDVEMTEFKGSDASLPFDQFIHIGDIINFNGSVCGTDAVVEVEKERLGKDLFAIGRKGLSNIYRVDVGRILAKRYTDNGIKIKVTQSDFYLYVPAIDRVLNCHVSKVDRESSKWNIINIISYNDFITKELKGIKATTIRNSRPFFEDLIKTEDSELATRIKDIAFIQEEKQAQLFILANKFRKVVGNSTEVDINKINIDIFKELSKSYWMVEKDEYWLKTTSTKSLNVTNEYKIGDYRLTEYQSNQIVKFSNPYMNGKKGAYVFVLRKNGRIESVNASRHSFGTIIKMLYRLSYIPEDAKVVDLMKDPYNIDAVNPDLFFVFYDVLYSKDGWNLNNMWQYGGITTGLFGSFHISMYKPTGIFYLTMHVGLKAGSAENKSYKHYVMPILPIGNMDRALMVASTTNVSEKKKELYKELMTVLFVEKVKNDALNNKISDSYRNRIIESIDRALNSDKEYDKDKYANYKNYYRARELAIQGENRVSAYEGLISDRVIYMMGTVHKGLLQVEGYESPDLLMPDDEEFDIEDEAEEMTVDDIDDDALELEDDDDFDMDDDEDDEEMLSIEELAMIDDEEEYQ